MLVERLEKSRPFLEVKSLVLKAIREFFEQHNFLEISTPILIDAPAPEENIESIKVGKKFLRTSPELQMKQLLCSGYERIYQMGPCFRAGEFGRKHRPEFTMLEWYYSGIDYKELLDFTTNLLRFVLKSANNNNLQLSYQENIIDFNKPPELIKVQDAYEQLGFDVERIEKDDLFDLVMVEKIEPKLGLRGLSYLIDYPIARGALAKPKENNPKVAERWELYIGGIELANAYTELTDFAEQKKRFAKAVMDRTASNLLDYPEPNDFFDALAHGMPFCSGCALGVDRLVMLLTNTTDIENVLPRLS